MRPIPLRRRRRRLLCASLIMGAALPSGTPSPAAETVSWDALLAGLRGGRARPSAVYFGSPDNRLACDLRNGRIPMQGLELAIVPADQMVRDPLTGRSITGARLRRLFGAGPGTLLLLDGDGLPLSQGGLPQGLHGDDGELIALWCAYCASGHGAQMSIADYARAIGREQVLERAIARLRRGFSPHRIDARSLVPARVEGSGAEVAPWRETGTFYVYAGVVPGRVLAAQLAEIAIGFAPLRPRLTVIVPPECGPNDVPFPAGVHGVLAHAPREALLAAGPSPCLVVTAHRADETLAIALDGFQSAASLAALLGLPAAGLETAVGQQDIPEGECDGRPAALDPAGPITVERGRSLP